MYRKEVKYKGKIYFGIFEYFDDGKLFVENRELGKNWEFEEGG